MKETYYINYHTGAGNFEFKGTLEEAMKKADEGAAYTQQNITIEINKEVIAYRTWNGIKLEIAEENLDEKMENPIIFGNFGFYADWVETEQLEKYWGEE